VIFFTVNSVGGQGLGFGDDYLQYWDGSPAFALALVYIPLFFLYPEVRDLLVKTIVVSLAATIAIWVFPPEALGWEPTKAKVLLTVGIPVFPYALFFILRGARVYGEIKAEEADDE
jgi:hypothetical protein